MAPTRSAKASSALSCVPSSSFRFESRDLTAAGERRLCSLPADTCGRTFAGKCRRLCRRGSVWERVGERANERVSGTSRINCLRERRLNRDRRIAWTADERALLAESHEDIGAELASAIASNGGDVARIVAVEQACDRRQLGFV